MFAHHVSNIMPSRMYSAAPSTASQLLYTHRVGKCFFTSIKRCISSGFATRLLLIAKSVVLLSPFFSNHSISFHKSALISGSPPVTRSCLSVLCKSLSHHLKNASTYGLYSPYPYNWLLSCV